ncbi:MAG: valine--tRNA ligase [Flavobacteriales bacterium]|jgi:valyl-tRNA synthetase|nr:valine--tRNA ligase [Flavobacteriales bacterium]
MEIPKIYESNKTEAKWYKYWMENDFFKSVPDEREAYTVVIPPPNVTGVLHMGHMLNNTIQDVLVRRARMLGKNACWVPGTDHASIATEAKVVAKLKSEGINKADLTRDEFLQHAWDWTEKHGGIILDQLKKLGASCDWDRTRFTLDKDYYESVIHVFNDLYEKGLIYRGVRMVNWDPEAKTALSDEEVNHKEVNSKLFYIRYKIEGTEDEWLTIATTRPETLLGDTAICVNPNDERYTHLKGKQAIVPLVNRTIPIIFDEYVDPEFGTGCLKITPAHDPNDYNLGLKYDLEVIDVLNDNGTINENGELYIGQDRFDVRKQIAVDLEENGYLVKTEDHINKIGFSERTDAVIEPKLSLQWFCSTENLSKPALENVMNDTIQFHPEKFKNSYRNWMENIKDWCISRQLWWGHQIPAYYYGTRKDDFVVAKSLEEAVEKATVKTGRTITAEDLKQDEDVLDTWFSSWLWPMSVFNGFKEGEDHKELDYYYPTNDLVTAPEIMFFWVARMIMAGYEYKQELPFKNVYYTGIVRDKLGRKMSKSLGNSPDPIGLIEKYGADGVRVGMLLSSPAGNDLPFDSAQCEQGRNFTNKVWNAFRLVSSWEVKEMEQPAYAKVAIDWFQSKLNKALTEINESYDKFRISEALMSTYKLVWDDFCSWYLEMVKPPYQQPIDAVTFNQTKQFFEDLLKLMHPFTPFISEEIWHLIGEREDKDCIMVKEWPKVSAINEGVLSDFNNAADVISNIRTIRKEKNIANKVQLDFKVIDNEKGAKTFDSVISKIGNLASLEYVDAKVDNAFSFLVKTNEYFIPFSEDIDVEAEIKKLKDELEYVQGSLKIVQKKLSNERFVNNAPEKVVALEKKKEADALAKIKVLEEKLTAFA